MTNFAAVNTAPVISSLTSKEKGSFGNRVDCATSQVGNGLKATAMAAGVVGTSIALGNNPKTASALEKGVNKVANILCKGIAKVAKAFSKTKIGTALNNGISNSPLMQKIGFFVEKGVTSLRTLSKNNPVLFGISALALTAIGLNKYYKSGQIDQKYTDRANAQKVAK